MEDCKFTRRTVLAAAAGWLAGWSLESIPFVVCGGIVILLLGIRHLDRTT